MDGSIFSSSVIVDGEASETDDEEFEDCVDDEETMETTEEEDISNIVPEVYIPRSESAQSFCDLQLSLFEHNLVERNCMFANKMHQLMQGYIGKSVNIVKSQITDFKNILTNIENAELGTQKTKVNLLQGLNQLDTMFTFPLLPPPTS